MNNSLVWNSIWDCDEFENSVLEGLLARFNSEKIKLGARKYAKLSGFTHSELKRIRDEGPFFVPTETKLYLDALINKRIFPSRIFPVHAGLSMMPNETYPSLSHINIEQVRKLPATLKRTGGGTLYRVDFLDYFSDGVEPNSWYVSIDASGQIYPCSSVRLNKQATDDQFASVVHFGYLLAFIINLHDFAQTQWKVQASEDGAKCSFLVNEKQIKSLFYARDLPLLATGRRRPILHWVSAHARRMKNGTEVAVNEHLKGISKFEMHGTAFQITQPIK